AGSNDCWAPYFSDDVATDGTPIPLWFSIPKGADPAGYRCQSQINGNGLFPRIQEVYTDAAHTTRSDGNKRTIKSIPDGTSNTLVIGKQWWTDNNDKSPWQLGYSFGWAFGLSCSATCAIPLNNVPYPPTAGSPTGFPGVGAPNAWIYLRGFRSLHPGGANF